MKDNMCGVPYVDLCVSLRTAKFMWS